MNTAESVAPKSGITQALRYILPELSAVITLLWVVLGSPLMPRFNPEAVSFMLVAEAGSLLFFCTLIDIATRIERRPPVWLGLLIIGAVVVLNGYMLKVLILAWDQGFWIFLPLLWSVLDRGRALWRLPGASRLEKIRRRTLTFDRLHIGILVVAISLAVALFIIVKPDSDVSLLLNPRLHAALGMIFYVTMAFDAWRVYRPQFEPRMRQLLPWVKSKENLYLDRIL